MGMSYWLRAMCIFLLLYCLLVPAGLAAAQTPPPTASDWIIEDHTVIENETIVMRGDIIIRNGGNLTIKNSQLMMHCNYPGHRGIYVEADGALDAHRTTFIENVPSVNYYFHVLGRANIKKCDLQGMYFNGLEVEGSGFAVVKDSEVHDNSVTGVGLFSGDEAIVIAHGNEVYNNNHGVWVQQNATMFLSNNNIYDNYLGIRGNQDTHIESLEDTIASSMRVGILLTGSASLTMEGSTITANSEDGIQLQDQSTCYLESTDVSGNERNGILSGHDSWISFTNSTLNENGEDGFQIQNNATVRVIGSEVKGNSIFGMVILEETKVDVIGSSISGNYNDGLQIRHNSTVLLQNNVINENTASGIFIEHNAKAYVLGNDISWNGENGIETRMNPKGEVLVQNNLISWNDRDGIFFSYPTNNVARVVQNLIDNNLRHGIRMVNGASPIILNCSINNSYLHGIYIKDLSRPLIYNSTISGSGGEDIWLGNNSHPRFLGTGLDPEAFFLNDSASDIFLGWWVRLRVVDENGDLVDNAQVLVRNGWNESIFNVTTKNGRTRALPIVEWRLNNSALVRYNPHHFSASKQGKTGSVLRNVTKNMELKIIFGIHQGFPHIRPELVPGMSILLSFDNLKNGQFISGNKVIKVRCSFIIDSVKFSANGFSEEIDLGTYEVVDGECTVTWKTEDQNNGKYRLYAQGVNSTLGIAIEENVDVIVENQRASMLATIASTGIAVLGAVGAAAFIGSGATSIKGLSGLQDLTGEYAEERLYEKARSTYAMPGIAQAALVVVSLLALTVGHVYSLIPDLEEWVDAFPLFMISVSIVIITMEMVEHTSAKRNGVESEFSLWIMGLLTLIATTLLFKMPFGSPGKTRVIDRYGKAAGLSGLAKLLSAPALLSIFIILIWNGFYIIGVIGGYTAVMLFFIDSIPVYPLEGRRVYDWNKGIWGFMFLSSLFLLFSWQQNWIGYDVLFFMGLVFALLLVMVMAVKKRDATAPITVIK